MLKVSEEERGKFFILSRAYFPEEVGPFNTYDEALEEVNKMVAGIIVRQVDAVLLVDNKQQKEKG